MSLLASLCTLLLVGWGAGGWMQLVRKTSPHEPGGFGLHSLLGLVGLAALLSSLSVLGLGRWGVLAVAYVMAAGGLLLHLRNGLHVDPKGLLAGFAFLLLLSTPIVLTAVTPPLRYDALAIWWPKLQEVAGGRPPMLWESPLAPLQLHGEYPRGLAWLGTLASPWGRPDPRTVKLCGLVFTWLVALTMADFGRTVLRSWVGFLAALLFVTLPNVALWSHSGYADLPLAGAILVTGIGLSERLRGRGGLVLAAVGAAGAASIKQEGFVILLSVIVLSAWDVGRRKRSLVHTLPGMIALATIAPWWWLRAGAPAEVLAPTFDVLTSPELLVSRVVAVSEAMGRFLLDPTTVWSGGGAREVFSWAAWVLLGCVAVVLPRGPRAVCTAPALWLLLSVFAVYVITPKDVDWHVHTALRRLVLQPLPLLLLAASARLVVRGGEEAGPGG